jgi:predicted nucleic acid-binding Zn ribbon protein
MTSAWSPPKHCVVCATALPRLGVPADAYPACSTVACRMVVARRSQMDEAGFKHFLQLQARLTMERATNMVVAHARANAEARENAAAWSGLRSKAGKAGSEPLRLLVPSGPARALRLSQRRRAKYRAHLLKLLREVAALDVAPALASVAGEGQGAAMAAAPSAMPGQLCGLCRGGCCTHGGEHAYLTAATLRRVKAQQGCLSDEDVVDAYLARLPARSQARSCINHTSRGCALPMAMRSDTCNAYACEALARLQHQQRSAAAPHVVLVVRRRQDNWRRIDGDGDNDITARAVLTEAGARHYRQFDQPEESLHAD